MTKDLCEVCLYPEDNPCQCLSCDPDGTRYLCKCDYEDEFVMFDEEVIRNLSKMKELINSMKTAFDYVRGDSDARYMMIETIDRAIEIIKQKH